MKSGRLLDKSATRRNMEGGGGRDGWVRWMAGIALKSCVVLFQAAFKVGGSYVAPPHGPLHVLFKQASVVLENFGRFFI